MSQRRVRMRRPDPRTMILKAAARLIVEEGYAAVSARAVAAKAGIKPAQLQYYFPKMDELLLAVYRGANARTRDREADALASAAPAMALWKTVSHSRMALGLEMMALANHKKLLRSEIARDAKHARELQAKALAKRSRGKTQGQTALGIAFLISAIGTSFVMERGIGLTSGHAEARAMLEDWLRQLTHSGSETRPKRGK